MWPRLDELDNRINVMAARLARMDDVWREEDHPRAEDGRFGSGAGHTASSPLASRQGKPSGGVAASYDAARRVWSAPGVDAERMKLPAIPPGWREVQ